MLRDSKTNNTDNVNVEDVSNLCCVYVEDCVPVVVICAFTTIITPPVIAMHCRTFLPGCSPQEGSPLAFAFV